MVIKIPALLPAIAWVPFFFALATPGTAVEDEPGHLARVAGVPANLLPATLISIISAFGYTCTAGLAAGRQIGVASAGELAGGAIVSA